MKEKDQEIIKIHEKNIYYLKTFKGWSIVIMPDDILIDNFHHGYAHIHPDRKEITTTDLNSTLVKVLKHINNNKGVNYQKLRKELIK